MKSGNTMQAPPAKNVKSDQPDSAGPDQSCRVNPIINAVICDDNPVILQQLCRAAEEALEDYPHKIHTYTNSKSLLFALQENQCTLAILDICLDGNPDPGIRPQNGNNISKTKASGSRLIPGDKAINSVNFCIKTAGDGLETINNGIRLAKEIHAACPGCGIIFTSSYQKYAVDVYEVEHVAFLRKEDINTRLKRVIRGFLEKPVLKSDCRISISYRNTCNLIPVESIIYLERSVRITNVHWIDPRTGQKNTISSRETIESLHGRINELYCSTYGKHPVMVRVHNSFSVSRLYVQSYRRNEVILTNGDSVAIARARQEQVMQEFEAMMWQ